MVEFRVGAISACMLFSLGVLQPVLRIVNGIGSPGEYGIVGFTAIVICVLLSLVVHSFFRR